MKISAITKFKNGQLWEALKVAGWTQTELARKTGLSKYRIGLIINMQIRPSDDEIAKIQAAFGDNNIYLNAEEAWPLGFKGLGKRLIVEQTREAEEVLHLTNSEWVALPDSTDSNNNIFHMSDLIDLKSALATLTVRERKIIEDRFYEDKESGQIATLHNISSSRLHQVEMAAFSKLRKKLTTPLATCTDCSGNGKILSKGYYDKWGNLYTAIFSRDRHNNNLRWTNCARCDGTGSASPHKRSYLDYRIKTFPSPCGN